MIKKTLKYIVGFSFIAFFLAYLVFEAYFFLASRNNMALLGSEAPELKQSGHVFRDLNKNGMLDLYEDNRLTPEERTEDLLAQMNLPEKAGSMFITSIANNNGGELVEKPTFSDLFSLMGLTNSALVARKHMNSFNVVFVGEPQLLARWHNRLQLMAERTRLGIPVTIASDPRHGFGENPAASLPAENFSFWPEPLGLAAIGDPSLVERFGKFARQEYRAVGIRLALHPMADLATEPRWARAAGTFGEDAHLSARLIYAYVKGFQGDELGPDSVITMVKHFSGGGPQAGGRDAHFPPGKEQIYPGDNFDYHLIPFVDGAFPAGAAQIMPYYGIPVGQTNEDVGFAFNKAIITGMLREQYGFEGVICSDWGLITDIELMGLVPFKEASAWGVEDLSVEERVIKLLDAGIDQFGGEYNPEVVVALVESGRLKEPRLDESVRRILLDKFRLGLFDNPFVDENKAEQIVGNTAAMEAGEAAQRRSLVMLKNGGAEPTLPFKKDQKNRLKVYVENIDHEQVKAYADVVSDPAKADFAIIRISAPFYPSKGIMQSAFHSGDLNYQGEEKKRLLKLLDTVPTVVDIYLDRAAVIPEIAERSAALVANFGATDKVLLELLWGEFEPGGKLPMELPRSMEAVEQQFEDVPYDTQDPLYPFGFGLEYQ